MVRKMHLLVLLLVHVSKRRKLQNIYFIYSYMTEYKQAAFHQSHHGHKIFQTPGLLRSSPFYSAVVMLQIYKPNSDGYYWDVPA